MNESSNYTGFANRTLPEVVTALLIGYEGWLVGSACPWFTGHTDEEPKDYDVIIPPHRWRAAMIYLKREAWTINAFGGLKFYSYDYSIDVWPDDLSGYYRMSGTKDPVWALSLAPRVLISRAPDPLTSNNS